ncbi:MAG: PEP-CTERM sorting domain-containing protein [Microcystis flos-aquae Mf_WU_F_19750830_S460]|nr:MAG: PEP-CTERM sorting domain-containing protein [Microcystis flos-aquae Mf_WU_F_19750830_S460]
MIPMMLPNDTNPFQQMTDPPMGSEQSIFYKANGEIKVASAEIKKKVPEPTSTLSLLSLGILGAASTLKRKLKPSQSIEKETTKVG